MKTIEIEELKKIIEKMEYKNYGAEKGSDEFEKAEVLREQGFDNFRFKILKEIEKLLKD